MRGQELIPGLLYLVRVPNVSQLSFALYARCDAPRHVAPAIVTQKQHIIYSAILPSLLSAITTPLTCRGNVAQLGLALARTFAPGEYRTYGLQLPDQQALVSLLSFLVGTTLGRFEGVLGGGRCRLWLVSAAFTQCLLAMAGALAAHYAGESGVAL
jgi:hypothetical protein